jgi:hypothetical protein
VPYRLKNDRPKVRYFYVLPGAHGLPDNVTKAQTERKNSSIWRTTSIKRGALVPLVPDCLAGFWSFRRIPTGEPAPLIADGGSEQAKLADRRFDKEMW